MFMFSSGQGVKGPLSSREGLKAGPRALAEMLIQMGLTLPDVISTYFLPPSYA